MLALGTGDCTCSTAQHNCASSVRASSNWQPLGVTASLTCSLLASQSCSTCNVAAPPRLSTLRSALCRRLARVTSRHCQCYSELTCSAGTSQWCAAAAALVVRSDEVSPGSIRDSFARHCYVLLRVAMRQINALWRR